MAAKEFPVDKGTLLPGELWEIQAGEVEIDISRRPGGVEVRVFTSRHSTEGIQFLSDYFVTFPSHRSVERFDGR